MTDWPVWGRIPYRYKECARVRARGSNFKQGKSMDMVRFFVLTRRMVDIQCLVTSEVTVDVF